MLRMDTPQSEHDRYIGELRKLADMQRKSPNPITRQWGNVHAALAELLDAENAAMTLPPTYWSSADRLPPEFDYRGDIDEKVEPDVAPNVAKLAAQLGASRVEPAPPTFYVPPIEPPTETAPFDDTAAAPARSLAEMISVVTGRHVTDTSVDVELLVQCALVQRLEVTQGDRLWTFDKPTDVKGTISIPRGDTSADVQITLIGQREAADPIRQTIDVWVPRLEDDEATH